MTTLLRASPDLAADCDQCVAICCVAPAFSRSSDFAIDKPAGSACPNLSAAARCTLHDGLRARGFSGCANFDCFGAGQRLARTASLGLDWVAEADDPRLLFDAFQVLLSLHHARWFLAEADAALAESGEMDGDRARVRDRFEQVEALASGPVETLGEVDLMVELDATNALLLDVSAKLRARSGGPATDHRHATLVGAQLQEADLRGAHLRGALLVGANLAGADLRWADFTGADLRGADLSGADLSTALFLSQPQVDSARGDPHTRLPPRLRRPARWGSAG